MAKNKKISAVYVVRNEDKYLGYSIASIIDFVDEVIIMDNQSTDETHNVIDALLRNFECATSKIKVFSYPYLEQMDMGKIRTEAINKVNQSHDWFWCIDADEIYDNENCKKIVEAVKNAPDDVISYRVGYKQMCMNGDFVEDDFTHYPDKLFRVGCGWHFDGILPVDMMKVGDGYYTYRPMLSYDNVDDVSFENPKQPILRDVFFYHYSRVKTYYQEFRKWATYCTNVHFKETGEVNKGKGEVKARHIKWVNNAYPIKRADLKPEVFNEFDFSKFDSYEPLVSVVITNYNYTRFLVDAIESVLDSTYKKIEIIVVDDGSNDDPDSVMQNFPQVKFIKKQNGGAASALNVGVAESRGDYYISLDADDKLHPEFIERAIGELKRVPGKMVVYGDLRTFGHKEELWSYGHYDINDVDKFEKSTDPVPQSAMVDRRLFDRVGQYDTKPYYFYDWDYWAKIYRMFGDVFLYMPVIHYFYRIHGPSNITKLEAQRDHNEEYMKNKFKDINRIQ